MPEVWTCSCGHRWTKGLTAEFLLPEDNACPACGSRKVRKVAALSSDEATLDHESMSVSSPAQTAPTLGDAPPLDLSASRTAATLGDAPPPDLADSRTAPTLDDAPSPKRTGPEGRTEGEATADWDSQDSGTAARTSPTIGNPPQQVTLQQDTVPQRPPKPPAPELPSVPGYDLIKELGRGGMGVVYQAKQAGLNRMVALKMVLSAKHASPKAIARFKAEAEAVALFQHPNIVQIYEISEYEGQPFFSLEFVDGGCLADKVAGIPQEPRYTAELVRVLADAMESAHRRGIIHRDLKPANVLLSTTGIPKITDFGLAKRFDEDSGVTRDGSVMGTPSYMAPEQAEGKIKQLGPPADIYALGAILYDLVTGRPPFRGDTLLETLQQVKTQEPVAPRRLSPRMPHDLEVITLKCLEKDPKKRYITAGSLADDLRRFLDGEPIHARPAGRVERTWKWVRRRPTTAALIAVSVLALLSLTIGGLVFGVNQARANREAQEAKDQAVASALEANEQKVKANDARQVADSQRQHAQTNFKRAWDAVQALVTVANERLVGEPRSELVRRDLLNKALRFLEAFLQERADDPQTRWDTARANLSAGDIHRWLNENDKAEQAYLTALRLCDDLVARQTADPQLPSYRYGLAGAHSGLAYLYMSLHRFPEADTAFARAEELRHGLQAADPRDQDNRRELAILLIERGKLRRVLGKYADAAASYGEAVKLLERLSLEWNDSSYRLRLAQARESLGDVNALTGNSAAAEQALRDAVESLRELASQFSEQPEFRDELIVAGNRLADVLASDRPSEARALYEDGLNQADHLVRDFPNVPLYRKHQAFTHQYLGKLAQVAGDFDRAEEHYRRQLDISTKLAAEVPDDPALRRDRGTQLNALGIFYLERNRRDEAGHQFADAIALFHELTEKYPEVPGYQHELARTQANQAALLLSVGRVPEAQKESEQAIAREQELVNRHPEVPDYPAELARMQRELGTLYYLSGQGSRVEQTYRDAIATYGRLRERFPDVPDYRSQLAVTYTNLGTLLKSDPKRHADAEKAYDEARALYEGLARQLPAVLLYRRQLADTHNSLGVLLTAEKKHDPAERELTVAVTLLQELVHDSEKVPALRQELSRVYTNRGFLMAARKDNRRAEEDLRMATEVLAPLPSSRPVLEDRARAWTNLAILLESTDRKEAGEKRRRLAVECHRQIVREAPKDVAAHERLAAALYDLANLQADLDQAETIATFRETAEHQKTAWELGHDARAQNQLCKVLFRRAEVLLRRNDHAAAAETVTELTAAMPAKYPYRHGAAALLARCVALAGSDDKLDEATRKARAKAYGDAAMKLLRQAVTEGFRNASALKIGDFAPLRDREDFKSLLAELEAK